MTLFSRHLDAATLGAAALDDLVEPRVVAHLSSCARCRRERDRMAAILDGARAEADDAIDAAFGSADLDRQRQAILQRIARTGGVARVLRFPAGADEHAVPARPAQGRWLLVAAAAGLLLGVAAGQLPHWYYASRPAQTITTETGGPPRAPLDTTDWRQDDALLSEVDAVLTRGTRPELAALDALTPVHYETR